MVGQCLLCGAYLSVIRMRGLTWEKYNGPHVGIPPGSVWEGQDVSKVMFGVCDKCRSELTDKIADPNYKPNNYEELILSHIVNGNFV